MLYQFLKAIKPLRKSRNLTQRDLASLSGTTQAYISRMESGAINPEADTLSAVAAALDAEVVFVPRRVLPTVRNIIDQHINPSRHPSQLVKTMAEELFIPDDDDEDAYSPGLRP